MKARRLLVPLVALVLAVPVVPSARAQSWTRVARWSAVPLPAGIAIDASGSVYVAGYGPMTASVCKYTPTGTQVASFGSYGTGAGQFDPNIGVPWYSDPAPWGIAVDAQGNLWVADRYNNRVVKFTPAGAVSAVASPAAMAVGADESGNVYVLGNGVLRKYSSAGTLQTSWTCSGVTLAVGPDGFLYTAGGTHIWKYTTSGAFVSEIGTGSFANLTGLAVDAGGHLFASDCWYASIQPSSSIYRIWEFTTDGALVTNWGDYSSMGAPVGVAVDAGGAVYVTNHWDFYSGGAHYQPSVDVYTRAVTPVAGTSWGRLKSLYR